MKIKQALNNGNITFHNRTAESNFNCIPDNNSINNVYDNRNTNIRSISDSFNYTADVPVNNENTKNITAKDTINNVTVQYSVNDELVYNTQYRINIVKNNINIYSKPNQIQTINLEALTETTFTTCESFCQGIFF